MNNDKITEVYDGVAGSPAQQRLARRRIHWICSQARGTSVLDIGCSQGIASVLLARERREVVGVDREEAALEFARARLTAEDDETQARLSFVRADASSLPFDDATFDTVLLGEILEHLIDPAAVLAEVVRVLRDGGVCVITTPYGALPYHDHKEPLYLRDVLRIAPDRLLIENVELLERYLALVTVKRQRRRSDATLAPRLLEVAEDRLRAVDTELLDQRRRADRAQKDLQTARDQLDGSAHALREAETRLILAESQRDHTSARLDDERQRFEQRLRALEERLEHERLQTEAQRAQALELSKDLAQVRAQEEVNRAASAVELRRLEQALTEAGSVAGGLEQQLRERDDQLSAGQAAIARGEEERIGHSRRMEAENAKLVFRVRSLERQLQRRDESIEQLERRAAELFERLEQRSAEAAELQTLLRQLQPRRAEAERRVTELEGALSERERHVNRLKKEREALLADVSGILAS
jgi:SAM-dependent methyltransferase